MWKQRIIERSHLLIRISKNKLSRLNIVRSLSLIYVSE
jgi:hypothetical protein